MAEEDEKKKKKKKKIKEDEEGNDTAKEDKKKKKKKKDKDGGDDTEAAATGESEVDDKKKKKKKKKDTGGETTADEAKNDKEKDTDKEASTLKPPELSVSAPPADPTPIAGTPRQDPRAPTRASHGSRASRASQDRAPSQLSMMPPIDRRASMAPSDVRRPSVAPSEVRRPSMAPSSVSNLLPALKASNQLQQQARAAPLPAQQQAGSNDNSWWDKDWVSAPRRVIPPVSKDTWAKMELLNKRLLVEPKQVKFEDEQLPDYFDLTMEYYTDGQENEKKKGKNGKDKSDKDTDRETDKEKGKKKKKDKKKDRTESDNELDDTEEDRDKKKKKKDKKKDRTESDNEFDDTEEDRDKKKKKKDKKKDRTESDNELDDTEEDRDKKKKKKDKKKDRTESDNELDDTKEDRDTKRKKREKKSKSASDAERDPPRRSSIRPKSEKDYGDEEDSGEDEEVDAIDFNPMEVVDPRMARIMARLSDARADPTESQLVDPLFPAKCECCSDRNNYTRGIIRDETVVARPHFIQKTIEDGLMVNRRDNGLGFYRSDSRVLIPVSNYVEKHLSTEMMNAGYSHEEARKIEHIRTKANQAIPPNLIEWPYYPNGPALAQELERFVSHDVPTSADGFVLSDTINDSSTKLDDAMRRLKKSISRF